MNALGMKVRDQNSGLMAQDLRFVFSTGFFMSIGPLTLCDFFRGSLRLKVSEVSTVWGLSREASGALVHPSTASFAREMLMLRSSRVQDNSIRAWALNPIGWADSTKIGTRLGPDSTSKALNPKPLTLNPKPFI